MGCGISSTKLKSSNPNVEDESLLTPRQKYIVKMTWRYLADDMTNRGSKVFMGVLQKDPRILNIFPFRDVNLDILPQDPRFRGHASRFMQAIGAAVDCLDKLDQELAPLLLRLGAQHAISKGFNPKYFDLFVDILLGVWSAELGHGYNDEVQEAWTLVFRYLLKKLEDGYMNAIKLDAISDVSL